MSRDREAGESKEQGAGGEEAGLTVEELQNKRAALEQKIQAVAARREQDIQAKMTEREALIAEELRLEPLVAEARGTLEYYQTQHDLGTLDPEDEEELQRLEQLVSALEKQWTQIRDRADKIMNSTEISARVYDEALAEDKKIGYERDYKSAEKKSEGKISELFDKVKNFSARQESFTRNFDEISKKLAKSMTALLGFRDRARGVLTPEKHQQTLSVLSSFYQETEPVKFMEGLREQRDKLGLWAGKEKAAIDNLLAKSGEFEAAQALWKQQQELAGQRDQMQEEFSRMREEYRDVFRDAWKDQNSMTEKYPGTSPDLPVKIWHHYSKDVIERFADIKRSEGGARVGRYENWEQAYKNNPGLQRIAHNWDRLQGQADGNYEIVMRSPEKWKEKS